MNKHRVALVTWHNLSWIAGIRRNVPNACCFLIIPGDVISSINPLRHKTYNMEDPT